MDAIFASLSSGVSRKKRKLIDSNSVANKSAVDKRSLVLFQTNGASDSVDDVDKEIQNQSAPGVIKEEQSFQVNSEENVRALRSR